MQLPKEVFEIILPQGLFEWFDIIESKSDADNVYITLEEKDLPPITPKLQDKRTLARKFHEFTVTDFPLRGKRTLITFKRRYWQVEGEKSYLKRDIKIVFPGTQLEREFALFLKEDGGRKSGLAGFYRKVSLPPGERI